MKKPLILPEEIGRIRREMGLSQRQMSYKLGVSYETMRAFEVRLDSLRNRKMTTETYYRLMDIYKIWKKKNAASDA